MKKRLLVWLVAFVVAFGVLLSPAGVEKSYALTMTFYPDSTAVDGFAVRYIDGNDTWADIRGGAGTDAVDYDNPIYARCVNGSSSLYREIDRGLMLFNTAGLPDDATISGATLSLVGQTGAKLNGVTANPSVNIYSSSPSSVTALHMGDYGTLGTTAFCDTAITYNNWNDYGTSYNDFVLNASGLAAVSKTGVSKFGFRIVYDATNSAPGFAGAYHQDSISAWSRKKGTSLCPKLVVTYTVPAVAPTVTTTAESAIYTTTCTGGGNVTSDGGATITERGVVYSHTVNPPTIASYDVKSTAAGTTGSYTVSTTGLTANYLYYSRAYATNSVGTGYGSMLSFTTEASTSVNLYWVGDTGNWSDTVTHWAISSGGAGGYAAPAATNPVYFDGSSFSTTVQTVTVDATANCASMDWTNAAHVPTLAGSAALNIYGYSTLLAPTTGMAVSYTGAITYAATSGTSTITSAGQTLGSAITFNGVGGTFSLGDNFSTTGSITLTNGTFNTNNHNTTCSAFASNNSNTRTLTLGSGTFTVNETAAGTCWDITTTTGITLSANTSTIVVTNSGSNAQAFAGGGLTAYNNLTVQGAGAYALTINSGNNTFGGTLTVDRSAAAKTITITASTNQTVGNFVCSTSGTTVLTIGSTTTTAGTLTKSGGGTIVIDYINLSYNTGSPAHTWYYGSHNTIGTGVTGWAGAGPPSLTLSAASSVGATTATFNGNVTDTGGYSVTVTMYYGTSDHNGTSVGWDSTVAPTSYPGGVAAFYYNASSLSTGTTYYYTAKAVNSQGTTWASPTDPSFPTIPAAPTDVSATDGTYPDKVTVTWTKSTGATNYTVLRNGFNDSGVLGDVATYDDTAGAAPTITPGAADATDGSSTSHVTCTLSGQSASNGTTQSYVVLAYDASGWSASSTADDGHKGTTTLSYQWQRSAADDPGSAYSDIGGAVANPYDDTAAPAPTITSGAATASDGTSYYYVTVDISGQSANAGAKRYFRCKVSMTGASSQYSTADEGYIGVGSLTYELYRTAT